VPRRPVPRWDRPHFTHTHALFKRIFARALSLLRYATDGTKEPWETGWDGGGRKCKLWPGGCSLMGKCFLLQVRRTLVLVSLYRHVDSPWRWSARRAASTMKVSCSIYCDKIYARFKVALYLRLLRILGVAWLERSCEVCLKNTNRCTKLNLQATKVIKLLTICRFEKRFETIMA